MSDKIRPFSHQQEAFDVIVNQRKSLYMIAGTASGKTLAVGLPLFHLLKAGEIRRVLFMYPTLALLDDQRQVMEKLAKITDLQVAEIKGGMSRGELVSALNCPVILATPDAIYWFFRKNVKFSSLLVYGLAQVDAFVLDEAHLFSGLSLRSLTLLKERILTLAQQLNKQPHWHILTATPHEELHALTTDGVPVHGKSKCGAVGLELLEPRDNLADGRAQMRSTVDKVIEQGAKKILLVFNSAAEAHSTFHQYGKKEPELPLEIRQTYGRVWLSALKKWMQEEGISEDAVAEVKKTAVSKYSVPLSELDRDGQVTLRTDAIITSLTDLFSQQVERAAQKIRDGESISQTKAIADMLVKAFGQKDGDVETAVFNLDAWATERIDQLETAWAENEIVVDTPNAYRLQDDLEAVGFSEKMSGKLRELLQRAIKVSPYQVRKWGHLPKSYRSRRVSLSWAVSQIRDPEEQAYFKELLDSPIALARLPVSSPHVGLWGESNVPIVLYSGKMPKSDREGQIQLFDTLKRAILVSTSAVEVGVDFDADVLITEQCPGPDLLQRFGRIGRREGVQGRVILQVHEQQAYFKLRQRLQESPTLSREAFSETVTELFPPRRYLSGSVFLDATHWLINDQIGRIGEKLNETMFPPDVAQLAKEFRQADLSFVFGLRGTMPQVGLRDGVTLSPFYALRKINNAQLWPSDSPFELAQADISYNKFIYEPSEWNVIVDWQRTLHDSQALFYKWDDRWQIRVDKGIGYVYLSFAYRKQRKILNLLDHEPEQYQKVLRTQPQHPLTRLGMSIQQLRTERRGLVLGFGNVYLKREDFHNTPIPMEDIFGTPLRLFEQTWLFIFGDELEVKRDLERLGLNDVEELIQIKCDDKGVMLVEAMVGATFQVYEKWGKTS